MAGPKWFGLELDDDGSRAAMLRSLKRRAKPVTTPYWKSGFVDWLVYEGTIRPCGLHVESIDEEKVTLCAHCVGVQTEGICLDATFEVPTADFDTKDIVRMVGPYRYHKHGPACRFEWFPRVTDPRVGSANITELEWWYDPFYDEKGGDNGRDDGEE